MDQELLHCLSKEELAQTSCGTPGCDCSTITLHACHSQAVVLQYDRDTGRLTTFCPVCKQPCLEIQVAETIDEDVH